jgi:uncharacterized protein (TIGR00369 family)
MTERSESFPPLPADKADRWAKFGNWDRRLFANVVGLEVEEVRTDYCRMRLPFRDELEQPAGIVHGGALATLVDTVVVPAVGQAYDAGWLFATVSMDIQYLSAIAKQDAIAEGWVVKRGSSLVFCRAEVHGADGRDAVHGTLVYAVKPPRDA